MNVRILIERLGRDWSHAVGVIFYTAAWWSPPLACHRRYWEPRWDACTHLGFHILVAGPQHLRLSERYDSYAQQLLVQTRRFVP